MSITVCSVSGKGGTGKSTVSSGLAIAAATLGKKVLIIDLDAGLRCLDMIFGIDDKIVFDLFDALEEGNLQKAVYPAANYQNIFVIPAPGFGKTVDFLRLRLLLGGIGGDYDYIILDFPAGADVDSYSLFPEATFVIVSGADGVSTRDAGVMSGAISANKPPRLIINRFDPDMIKYGVYKSIDGIINTSGARLLGIVPADGELLLLGTTHKLKKRGRALKAFNRILGRISGEDVRLPDPKRI